MNRGLENKGRPQQTIFELGHVLSRVGGGGRLIVIDSATALLRGVVYLIAPWAVKKASPPVTPNVLCDPPVKLTRNARSALLVAKGSRGW